MFFSKRIPTGKTKCASCNSTGTETYYEDVRRSWADSRVDRVQKTRDCRVCGGLGYL